MLRRLIMIVATVLALSFGGYGQPATAAAGKAAAKSTAKNAKAKAADTKAAATGLLDINSAKAEELDALPGIGKVYSKKIVDGRPYVNKTQLVSKGVLPKNVYDKIADKIIAKQK